MKVIVVDDNPFYCQFLRTVLTTDLFEVVGEAYDGTEAVRMVREQQPEVVVMDINMPQMDGLEAAQIIKADFPGTVVILTSTDNDAEYHRRAQEVGAKAFIPKAVFSAQALGDALARINGGG